MIRIDIKPISVNDVWQGKRYKTDEYKKFEEDLMFMLPNIKIELDKKKKYQIHYKWYFSSASSDFDNPIKPITDIISKYYGFNDRLIKRAIIEVEQVKKGKEFFEFKIIELT
jgi:Holliday junction resolvase RusA-like endonuclease